MITCQHIGVCTRSHTHRKVHAFKSKPPVGLASPSLLSTLAPISRLLLAPLTKGFQLVVPGRIQSYLEREKTVHTRNWLTLLGWLLRHIPVCSAVRLSNSSWRWSRKRIWMTSWRLTKLPWRDRYSVCVFNTVRPFIAFPSLWYNRLRYW